VLVVAIVVAEIAVATFWLWTLRWLTRE